MKYPLAERFKAPQGEGIYTGTPMAFMRLVGCSVGQTICTACDTEFLKMDPAKGGGIYTLEELLDWTQAADPKPYQHINLTGGEPLDRDLSSFIKEAGEREINVHIETSGTVLPPWLQEWHEHDLMPWNLWITVSPKPGFMNEMLIIADEIKVILGGLGDGPGWPTVEDAVRWEETLQKAVFIQPRNYCDHIDHVTLGETLEVLHANPSLRLSVQLHKFIRTR